MQKYYKFYDQTKEDAIIEYLNTVHYYKHGKIGTIRVWNS